MLGDTFIVCRKCGDSFLGFINSRRPAKCKKCGYEIDWDYIAANKPEHKDPPTFGGSNRFSLLDDVDRDGVVHETVEKTSATEIKVKRDYDHIKEMQHWPSDLLRFKDKLTSEFMSDTVEQKQAEWAAYVNIIMGWRKPPKDVMISLNIDGDIPEWAGKLPVRIRWE